jgi:hypothetical protein
MTDRGRGTVTNVPGHEPQPPIRHPRWLDTTLIRQVNVDTWLDDQADRVTLTVDSQTLPDATNYAAVQTLNLSAKEIVAKIVSSNYQKLAN